ncbi:retention module-containing protein, partial [Marinomonas sp. A79]
MSDSQVPFATLGSTIGFISKATGLVIVQSIDGQERVVKIGDPVFFGETVVTGTGVSVTIAFIDGSDVVIGDDSIVELTDEIYNTGDEEELVADSTSEVDALQAAILAGVDPTLVQEAPAAGDATDEQQRFDVDVERNDDTSLPTFGVDTLSALPTYGYDTDNGDAEEDEVIQEQSSNTTTAAATIAAVAGTVVIDSITDDNVINSTEASGTITVSGSATGGDISQGDALQLVVNGTTYNTTVESDGSWSVDVAGSDLAADTNATATVTSTNDTGSTVTSTGDTTYSVNQAPTTTAATGSVTEDASITGSISAEDVDLPAGASLTFSTTSTAAGLTFNSDGSYVFEASSYDGLELNEIQTIVIPVTVTDDQDAIAETTLTITVTGTNDAATISGDTSASGSETDVALSLGGTLTATDVDNTDNAFTTQTTVGTNGTFTIAENGDWTFVANSAFNELNVGDSKVESFNVTSVDGTPSTVIITINGTNDAATVSSASVALTETDSVLSTGGTLTATDVDNVDNSFTASNTTGTYGKFAIGTDGAWTFTANSTFDELNVNDSYTETFNVTSVDGTASTVTITIKGTNDAATISGDTSASGSETDAALTLGGTLTATDVDNTNNAFNANEIEGANGTFTIAENGDWTFVANSTFNELNVGDSKVESFNVTSVDGTVQAVTVTINGTNDAASISGETSASGSESDVALSLGGTLTATDVDNTDNAFTANEVEGANGTFTIAENGDWTFVANSAFNELNVGDSKAESFNVTSVDGTEQLVTVTINGTNDAASISGDASVVADETNVALSLSGTLTATDVDNADNTFTADTIVGTNGTFTISENGEWTFEANSAFNELNVGDSKVESFNVTSVDGTVQAVTVTINGTNDAVIISGDTSASGSETDEALTLSGALTATDVDNTDNA